MTGYGRVYAMLLVVVLLSSCSLAVRPGDSLLEARDDFSQRLRWQDCNGAGRYLAPEQKADFLERCQADEDLHYVGVETQSVELSDDQRQADTVTLVEYYRLPSVVVKKFRLRQMACHPGEGMETGYPGRPVLSPVT
ncbi:MAG: hypothetical protein R2864_07330 [Syntrophotaleaceae bacterium]